MIQPSLLQKSFTCPHCHVISRFYWGDIIARYDTINNHHYANVRLSYCEHCTKFCIWIEDQMIFPIEGSAEAPNEDMPDDVLELYNEAKSILNLSPKGSAALLRLALQKLCKHLGEQGANINDDIKALVAKGLPTQLQQALDTLRIVGNQAVHPGEISFEDNPQIASSLFGLLNFVCDSMISQPKKIASFYQETVPENLRNAADKRDGRTT